MYCAPFICVLLFCNPLLFYDRVLVEGPASRHVQQQNADFANFTDDAD